VAANIRHNRTSFIPSVIVGAVAALVLSMCAPEPVMSLEPPEKADKIKKAEKPAKVSSGPIRVLRDVWSRSYVLRDASGRSLGTLRRDPWSSSKRPSWNIYDRAGRPVGYLSRQSTRDKPLWLIIEEAGEEPDDDK